MDFKIIHTNWTQIYFCDTDVERTSSGNAVSMFEGGYVYRGTYNVHLKNGSMETRYSVYIHGDHNTSFIIIGLKCEECKKFTTEKEVTNWIKEQSCGLLIQIMMEIEDEAHTQGVKKGEEIKQKEITKALGL